DIRQLAKEAANPKQSPEKQASAHERLWKALTLDRKEAGTAWSPLSDKNPATLSTVHRYADLLASLGEIYAARPLTSTEFEALLKTQTKPETPGIDPQFQKQRDRAVRQLLEGLGEPRQQVNTQLDDWARSAYGSVLNATTTGVRTSPVIDLFSNILD